jgi:hypothetical protein
MYKSIVVLLNQNGVVPVFDGSLFTRLMLFLKDNNSSSKINQICCCNGNNLRRENISQTDATCIEVMCVYI